MLAYMYVCLGFNFMSLAAFPLNKNVSLSGCDLSLFGAYVLAGIIFQKSFVSSTLNICCSVNASSPISRCHMSGNFKAVALSALAFADGVFHMVCKVLQTRLDLLKKCVWFRMISFTLFPLYFSLFFHHCSRSRLIHSFVSSYFCK